MRRNRFRLWTRRTRYFGTRPFRWSRCYGEIANPRKPRGSSNRIWGRNIRSSLRKFRGRNSSKLGRVVTPQILKFGFVPHIAWFSEISFDYDLTGAFNMINYFTHDYNLHVLIGKYIWHLIWIKYWIIIKVTTAALRTLVTTG